MPFTSIRPQEGSAGVGQNTIAGPTHWAPQVTTIRESVKGAAMEKSALGGQAEAGTSF